MIRDILRQITTITSTFINKNLAIEYQFPVTKDKKIEWENCKDISYTLKNQPYCNVYNQIVEKKDFNIRFPDGAIFQFMYSFDSRWRNIIAHRLAYFPSLYTKPLTNLDYIDEFYGAWDMFSDIEEMENIVCPIRFDYDSDPGRYIEHDHSYSHCTIWNYKNCRIPVTSPVNPFDFINFILKHFYNELYNEHFLGVFWSTLKHPSVLSTNEKNNLHLFFPSR